MAGPVLTHRQQEVFALLVKGKTNKEIGQALGCSVKTIKSHVTGIFKATGYANRVQAIIGYYARTQEA